MKIRAIHTFEAGPLGTQTLDFKDTWSGEISGNILFSGPNGCGKSSLLRAISKLWESFGHWLHNRKPLPKGNAAREWLQRWDGVALVLEEVPFNGPPLVLCFGAHKFIDQLKTQRAGHCFVGESVAHTGKPGAPVRQLLWPADSAWLDQWAEARQKMMVNAESHGSPNLLFLDAEERRWVTPRRGIGEMKSDNLQQRWLASYRVSDQWDGQLEASLLAMKVATLQRFHELLRDLNSFLVGKEIMGAVKTGENRLRVKIKGRTGTTHFLDELSAGEHQVLIQLYMVHRWLESGGIALIDEPDLYLHPSLISGFLATLEKMVADRKGQLLITSHVPEVWSRYEALGQRVLLEAQS